MKHQSHDRPSPRRPGGNGLRAAVPAITLAALLVVGAAACGDDNDDEGASAAATTAPSTDEAPTLSTKPASTTSTSVSPSATAADGSSTTAAPTSTASPIDDQADGSGCSPGEGVLPDGQWYGIAAGVTIDQLDFDLACWFSGAAAEAAAAADGAESPPPNDYHVRNTVETTRALHPAAGTPVVWYPEIGSPGSETGTTYAAWVDTDPERPRPGIWITIENGEVTAIAEQWVP